MTLFRWYCGDGGHQQQQEQQQQHKKKCEVQTIGNLKTPVLRKQRPPRYHVVDRSVSLMLEACWEQDWPRVIALCVTHPRQAYHISHNTGRTALHLATMPGAYCPSDVIRLLLHINPHAILVSDHHPYGGTPMHFVCGSHHRNNPSLIRQFCETAIRMRNQYLSSPSISDYSPLYLAAKVGAPPQTLQVLVETQLETDWIAPWTGAEHEQGTALRLMRAWQQNDNNNNSKNDSLAGCAPRICPFEQSPLATVWICQSLSRASCHYEDYIPRMREIAVQMLRGDLRFVPDTTGSEILTLWTQLLVLMRPSMIKDWQTPVTADGLLSRWLHLSLSMIHLWIDLFYVMYRVCNVYHKHESMDAPDFMPIAPLHQLVQEMHYSSIRLHHQEQILLLLVEEQPRFLEQRVVIRRWPTENCSSNSLDSSFIINHNNNNYYNIKHHTNTCNSNAVLSNNHAKCNTPCLLFETSPWYPVFMWAQKEDTYDHYSHVNSIYIMLRACPQVLQWQCQLCSNPHYGCTSAPPRDF
jgi:hypothetical protein